MLFPADPARAEKRHDRARALCAATGVTLLTLGGVPPEQVPLWVNAADAVIVPSEREGFGLAALEALACGVPVLATRVGIHAAALAGVPGSLCAPFDIAAWRAALQPHLRGALPAGAGGPGGARTGLHSAPAHDAERARASAMRFSARRMAERVAAAWRAALERAG